MTKDELKLALKHATRDERHLSNAETRYWCDQYKLLATQAIEALAQPESWEKFCDSNCVWTDHHPDCKMTEQDPVAWRTYTGRGYYIIDATLEEAQKNWPDRQHRPLYTSPPPQRKPLTDSEIGTIAKEHIAIGTRSFEEFARRIEAAHGIKGKA